MRMHSARRKRGFSNVEKKINKKLKQRLLQNRIISQKTIYSEIILLCSSFFLCDEDGLKRRIEKNLFVFLGQKDA